MRNYLLVYRTDYSAMPKVSPEQAEAVTKQWMNWFDSINADNKLVDMGNRLEFINGKVVKPGNVVINGPYAEIKESIGGYSIIKAESYEGAVEVAKGCPILSVGGNVEVREINNL